jgi:CheY-like chemotaxis protein
MPTNYKILLIEDDANVAATVRDHLGEQFGNLDITVEQNLNNAVNALVQAEPDAVILDLIEGPLQAADIAGNLGWQEIWNHRFVPLIVYTASAQDTDPPLPTDHPFIVRIQKGQADSINEVSNRLRHYLPYMESVRELSVSASRSMHMVLKETAPLLWKGGMPDQAQTQLFSRILKRRIAASADISLDSPDLKLSHWEQFIYPPLESDLLTGDLLRVADQPWDNPDAYRVVLTPSCDLVRRNGSAKVEAILVARSVSLTEMWAKCQIKKPDSDPNKKEAEKLLSLWLTELIPRSGILPLPDFPNILPFMAINLRALDLIQYDSIKGFEDGTSVPIYERIVSVDSPFREALVWAYMHVACRTCLPDREIEPWIAGAIEAYSNLINKQQ